MGYGEMATISSEDSLQRLEKVIFDPILRKRMTPLFFDFMKRPAQSKEGLRYYFRQSQVIFDTFQMKDKRILDIGCGFGLRLICFSLLGASKCVGIDISEEELGDFRKIVNELSIDVEPIYGDFLKHDFPAESFDAVVLIEAISHIRDTDLLLNRIQRVVRQQGGLFVSDANNSQFLPSRIKSRMTWTRSESGPLPKNMSAHGREVDRLSFLDARMKIIKDLFPSVDQKTLRWLAKKTQGMYGHEIAEAVDEFKTKGKISATASFRFRNPYTGEYPELDFNPIALIGMLEKKGFQANLVSPIESRVGVPPDLAAWKQTFGNPILKTVRNCPEPLLPYVYPSFTIVATKSN